MSLWVSTCRWTAVVLAVSALALPAQALPWCRCCEAEEPTSLIAEAADSDQASPVSAPVRSCCGKKQASNLQIPAKDLEKHGADQPAGHRPCSTTGCTSPCSLGKPVFQHSTTFIFEMLAFDAAGFTAEQQAQQPHSLTIDGLLRPPRA